MFNNTNHLRNANQSHTEVHACQMAITKITHILNIEEGWIKANLCTLLLGVKIGTATMENSTEVL